MNSKNLFFLFIVVSSAKLNAAEYSKPMIQFLDEDTIKVGETACVLQNKALYRGLKSSTTKQEVNSVLSILALNSGTDFRGLDSDHRKFFFKALIADLQGRGADINNTTQNKKTPLHWAINEFAQPEMVEALLECGADCSLKDDNGKTALELVKVTISQEEKCNEIKSIFN